MAELHGLLQDYNMELGTSDSCIKAGLEEDIDCYFGYKLYSTLEVYDNFGIRQQNKQEYGNCKKTIPSNL